MNEFKVLLFSLLAFTLTNNAYAGISSWFWHGEAIGTGCYHVYDKATGKFIGHAASGDNQVPVLVDRADADVFRLFTVDKDGDPATSGTVYTAFQNATLGGKFALNVDNDVFTYSWGKWIINSSNAYYPYYNYSKYNRARGYSYGVAENEKGKYYGLNYQDLAHYCSMSPLSQNINGKSIIGYVIGQSQYVNWQMISLKQYTYKIAVEALVKILDDNEVTIDTETRTKIEAAMSGSNYTDLKGLYNEAYTAALANETVTKNDNLKSQLELNTTIFNTMESADALFGMGETDKANALLAQANTAAAVRDDANGNYADAQSTLRTELEAKSSYGGVIRYCADMKALSESMGFPFPAEGASGLMEKINNDKETEEETEKEAEIDSYVAGMQTLYKKWVTETRVGGGQGFPMNTDMSAFILNNGFECEGGDILGWTTDTGASLVNNESGNSKYFQGTSLSQEVTNVPEGHYKLSATTTGVISVSGTNISNVTTNADGSVEFDVTASGSSFEISVAPAEGSTTFTADKFRLYLMSGAATEFAMAEKDGLTASVINGLYSKVTMNRNIKNSDTWNTFCAPFAINAEKTAELFKTVKQITSVTLEEGVLTLHYTESDEIEPGVAYLVKANPDNYATGIKDIIVEAVGLTQNPIRYFHETMGQGLMETETRVASIEMLGTFSAYATGKIPYFDGTVNTNEVGMTTWILQNNDFKRLNSSSQMSMKAFRAYFNLYDSNMHIDGEQAGAAMMRMSFDDSSTNIEELEQRKKGDEIIYSLDGVRLSSTPSGMCVKNGKVIFVK